MKDRYGTKNAQINNILSVVKITSLLFSVMICLKLFTTNGSFDLDAFTYDYNSIYVITPLIGIVLIYVIWTFSNKKEIFIKRNKYIIHIENTLFIVFFIIIIIITGLYQSEYKFLFLFIIITVTIESGLLNGMITAIASAVIILSIDLIFAPSVPVNLYFENDLILSSVFILIAWPLGFYVKVEGEHIKMLESMVNYDGLTEVYNHRYFHMSLKENIRISNITKEPLALLFLDIDYFKYYNDLNGHQNGDKILKMFGSVLSRCVGNDDVVARYGGEEFAIILTNTSESKALEIAEKTRYAIENTYFEGEENQPNGKLTASIGVSVYPDKANDDLELIKCADDALYRAKFFKKNRVESYVSILDEIKGNIKDKDIQIVTSIKTLISVINAKDRYTYGHTERVVLYSKLLADKINLSIEDKNTLIYGAYMHDIGKISIPKEVLIKKMPLTNDEWELLRGHPESGLEIIKGVEALANVNPIVLYHHEKYNGLGYPEGLKGEEIPYLARVLSIVDSFDAMTSNRPYNKCKSFEEAIGELRKCSGEQFDPNITEEFIAVIEENKDNFHKL